mmetsp:Transcript_4779/g.3974  ORF Transcript_4779/g.3974 Transcript_4779/m.3974 type:complete len:132 (+) Transcript_4779:406-801(+)
MELNRVHQQLADKEKIMLEHERDNDNLKEKVRKLYDENHKLKIDFDSAKMEFDSILRQKDLEITNIRRYLNEERLANHHPPVINDTSGEAMIQKLKHDLEDAYRKIDELQHSKKVEFVEKARYIDRVIEKP